MLTRPFRVAVNIYDWAYEQGFIGVAVYVVLWVVAFPIMAGICIVGAILGRFIDKETERELSRDAYHAPRNEAEKLQWEEEDRSYKEALSKRQGEEK